MKKDNRLRENRVFDILFAEAILSRSLSLYIDKRGLGKQLKEQ